ncbi:MAG: WD40 repeat domain-containing protein [Muribaculaceae bacterium]|nr:WD40 repeat domain-containing protein [Muribaculaceae bacterium]
MNKLNHRILALATAVTMLFPASLKALDGEDAPFPGQLDYRFKFPETPAGLARFSTVAYPYAGAMVYSVRGKGIVMAGDDICDLDINPAGFNFVVVTKNAKGTRHKAKVYGTKRVNQLLHRFSNKIYGNPTCATYTPDALRILLATDQGLHIVDSRNFKPLDTMPLVHDVTNMVLSGNAYHLATTDGHKVTVYNYEDKSVRHQWDFESEVKDLLFSDDDTEFAVLTDDGLLSIYDTRTYVIKNTVDELGDGIAASYNLDSKYMAVAQSPTSIAVVNLVDEEDPRQIIEVPDGDMNDLIFLPDSRRNTMLAFCTRNALDVKRMNNLTPYYSKLVNDEVNRRFNEWLKMMPGETLEEYKLRVNDETRAAYRRMLEDEVSTRIAPDLISMAEISLGQYDSRHGLLEVGFSNMPPIYLPVPNDEVDMFTDPSQLMFSNARYSVTNGDRFELIYAEVLNSANGTTYIYNNVERAALRFMEIDEEEDEKISLELLQQQQMEELKLKEIQAQVVEEAKSANIISDHTNITVSTEVEPDYDANGNKILNYKVRFQYEVDPEYTAHEDFGPGKYHIEQSGAAKSMLEIVKKSLDGELSRYVKEGKKLNVRISGTADSSPIVGRIIYDGVYGPFEDEPVMHNGELTGITVTPKERITQNEQLAFLRAQGVKQYLIDNIKELNQMKTAYQTIINVAEGKGSQFRRITAELIFVDAF